MKGRMVLVLATLLLAFPAGARDDSQVSGQAEPGVAPAQRTPEAADNTGRNVRDRNGNTVTPLDQSNSPTDLRITQAIRKAIVDDDDLSMNAKNVKVITSNGVVTLRGPVESPAERSQIEAVASKTSDVRRVDNQLEVARATD